MKPGARVEAEALEADRPRRRLEGLGIVVRHGDVEGDALHVLRRLRAADGAVVLRAAVGRADDQRLAETRAQRLQRVERCLVDEQLAGAAAGDLGGREVRPAPGGRRHVAPVGVEGHGDPPGQKKRPAELAGGGGTGLGGRRGCRPRKQKGPPHGSRRASPTGRCRGRVAAPAFSYLGSANSPTSRQHELARDCAFRAPPSLDGVADLTA